MLRPSPTDSATLYKIGTKKKGNDNNMWIVVKNVNGIKRWKLYKKYDSIELYNFKHYIKNQITTNNKFKIFICEPTNDIPLLKNIKPNNTNIHIFEVDINMYLKLTKRPKIYRRVETASNAYIFGKKYQLDTYKQISSFGNDIAQIGMIDITNFTKDEYNNIIYRDEKYGYKINTHHNNDWENEQLLFEWRSIVTPRILFIGSTDGGDVGAYIYAHYTNKKIDSIILDNRYFFTNIE